MDWKCFGWISLKLSCCFWFNTFKLYKCTDLQMHRRLTFDPYWLRLSKLTLFAREMQAMRRGWVQAMWLKPAERRYWGTWVDLPQPVSPATTTTGWSRTRSTIRSRYWKMGRFFCSRRSLASFPKLCFWLKSKKCSKVRRQSEISWDPGPEDLWRSLWSDFPSLSLMSLLHTDTLILYRASYSLGRPRSSALLLSVPSSLDSFPEPDISLFVLNLWKRSKKAQNSLCSGLPAWM